MKYKLFPPQAIHELGQRSNQEDNIFPAMGRATADDRLFIVCDGMGGHEHGEVASQAVVDVLSQYIAQHHRPDEAFTDQALTDVLQQAYDRLDALDTGEARKMGTTLTLLYLHRGGVTAAHIGDSRIYHLRPNEGEILYCSRDHSLVMDLYQAGEITRDEMRTSPQKNIITRAMSPGEEGHARADIIHIADVRPGDYFYLCSDGMLEQMEDDELLALISDNTTDSEKRETLIRATAGNKDNHSAYLIHVERVEKEPGDEALIDDERIARCNVMNIYREREAQDAEDVSIVAPPPRRPREIPVDAIKETSTPHSLEGTAHGLDTSRRVIANKKKSLLIVAIAAVLALAAACYYIFRPAKSDKPMTGPIPTDTAMHVNAVADSAKDRKEKVEAKAHADSGSSLGETPTAKPAISNTSTSHKPIARTPSKRGWYVPSSGSTDTTKHI